MVKGEKYQNCNFFLKMLGTSTPWGEGQKNRQLSTTDLPLSPFLISEYTRGWKLRLDIVFILDG